MKRTKSIGAQNVILIIGCSIVVADGLGFISENRFTPGAIRLIRVIGWGSILIATIVWGYQTNVETDRNVVEV